MEYVVAPARPPLSAFVEYFWFIRESPTGTMTVPHRVLPDGRIELIVNLGHPHRLYDDDTLQRWQTFRSAWIAGIRRDFIFIAPTVCTHMIGARFRPGGLAPFVAMPVHELTHQVVDLDLIIGQRIHEARERLLETEDLSRRFVIFEQLLLDLAGSSLEHDLRVDHAVRRIHGTRGQVPIGALSSELGVGSRHFSRQFRHRVGLGPKALSRICRFQRAIAELERKPSHDWLDLALRCGYYDQAHLINEFKEFCGLTPARYLHAKGEYVNFVPLE